MKAFIIKKDKWHQSGYSIYQSRELIGEYFPEKLRRPHRLSLRDRDYTFKKRSVWSREMELYLGNVKVADIYQHPFKASATISFFSKGQFIYKRTNSWKNIYSLTDGYKPIGESRIKSFTSTFTVGDSVDENLLASVMFISQQQRQKVVYVVIALIPTIASILGHHLH